MTRVSLRSNSEHDADTTMLSSDEEPTALDQHGVAHQSLLVSFFDMRSVSPLQPVQQVYEYLNSNRNDSEIKERHNAELDEIHILDNEKEIRVVLHQDEPNNLIAFVELFPNLSKLKYPFEPPEVYCIKIPKQHTGEQLLSHLQQNFRRKTMCLCIGRRKFETCKTLTDVGLLQYGTLSILCQKSFCLRICYRPEPPVEKILTLDLSSTDTISTLREKILKEKLSPNFLPSTVAVDKENKIYFTYGTNNLDDSFCIGFLGVEYVRQMPEFSEILLNLHLAPKDSIHVNLGRRADLRRQGVLPETWVLMVHPNWSTEDLRSEVAKFIRCAPNALKLFADDRLIPEVTNLREHKLIYPQCKVSADLASKKRIHIRRGKNVDLLGGIYLLDSVASLKRQVAMKYKTDPLYLNIEFQGTILRDEKRLNEYPIRNNVTLDLHEFENRLILHIQIIFQKRTKLSFVVDDARKTKVQDIQRFLGKKYEFLPKTTRVICANTCLESRATLADAGIRTGNTLVLVYFQDEEKPMGSLIRIFMASNDGHVRPRIGAVNSGVLTYVEADIPLSDLKITLPESHDLDLTCGLRFIPDDGDLTVRRPNEFKGQRKDKNCAGLTYQAQSQTHSEECKRKLLHKAKRMREKLPKHQMKDIPYERLSKQKASPTNEQVKFFLPKSDSQVEVKTNEDATIAAETVKNIDDENIIEDDDIVRDGSENFSMDDSNGSIKSSKSSHEESSEEETRPISLLTAKTNVPKLNRLNSEVVRYLNEGDINSVNTLQNTQKKRSSQRRKSEGEANRVTVRVGSAKFLEQQGQVQTLHESQSDPTGLILNSDVVSRLSESTTLYRHNRTKLLWAKHESSQIYRVDHQGLNLPVGSSISLAMNPQVLNVQDSSDIPRQFIEYLSTRLGVEWKKFFRKLDFESNELDMTYQQKNGDLHETCYSLLEKWVQKKGRDAKTETLIQKLGECEWNDMADKCRQCLEQLRISNDASQKSNIST